MEIKISPLYSSGFIVRAAQALFTSSNSIAVSTF